MLVVVSERCAALAFEEDGGIAPSFPFPSLALVAPPPPPPAAAAAASLPAALCFRRASFVFHSWKLPSTRSLPRRCGLIPAKKGAVSASFAVWSPRTMQTLEERQDGGRKRKSAQSAGMRSCEHAARYTSTEKLAHERRRTVDCLHIPSAATDRVPTAAQLNSWLPCRTRRSVHRTAYLVCARSVAWAAAG